MAGAVGAGLAGAAKSDSALTFMHWGPSSLYLLSPLSQSAPQSRPLLLLVSLPSRSMPAEKSPFEQIVPFRLELILPVYNRNVTFTNFSE